MKMESLFLYFLLYVDMMLPNWVRQYNWVHYLIKKLNLSMFLNAIPVPIATTRNGSSAT